jgi:hypothetical protein
MKWFSKSKIYTLGFQFYEYLFPSKLVDFKLNSYVSKNLSNTRKLYEFSQ